MENFTLLNLVDSNNYIATYEAYDKVKKCYCYIEIPQVKTSWEFSVTY